MCAPLLARFRHPVEAALKEAGITAADLLSCELVGGSTRIGCVKRELESILGEGVTLSTTMNADEAVARGATLQAAILSPRFKVLPYEIQEAQPYPILISWQDDKSAAGVEVDATTGTETPTDSVVMFDRGLSFPIVRRVSLRRSGTFVVKSKYDESALKYGLSATSSKEIADFMITAPAGDDEKKVRVNVKQDIHGIIHLSSVQMVEEVDEEGEAVAAPAADAAAAAADKKEATPAEVEAEKKKKIKKTNLEFTVTHSVGFSREEINKQYEAEVAMANTDRIVKETADMRNELESYIYDMRDKIESAQHYGPYGTDKEKALFANANEAMETWLYEDGFDATKTVYAEKLGELKKFGGPLEKRRLEAESRPAAVTSLKATLEIYNKWVNASQTDDRYEHITDEERATVHGICEETSAWLYEMLDKQGGMSQCQDPIMTVALLNSKKKDVIDKCKPVMSKPAPKKKEEPKKEEPKKEDPPAAKTPAGDAAPADAEPMEVENEAEEATKMEVE
jgi:heat shock protein 4